MKLKTILILILVIGFFLRVYRIFDLMGFYFDQGRDAKIIWDLWHSHKFFLIGPTTGIEGIFLGPFYYYLIAPAYLLGGGSPVLPAIELALINIAGIYLVYKIGKDFFNEKAGLIAAFLLVFSNRLVQDHRWLSNPTPLPLFAVASVYLLLKIINSQAKTIHYLILGFCLGLSLQLEAASATFFLPATLLIFLLIHRQIFKQFANLVNLAFSFFVTLIPQLYFNYRHDNILFQGFKDFLITKKSFGAVSASFYFDRLKFYCQVFFEKLINDNNLLPLFILLLLIGLLFAFNELLSKNTGLLVIWIITPLLFLLFYHGNYGYIWGYYFTGVYPIFILLTAFILSRGPKPLAILLLLLFFLDNTKFLKNFLTSGIDGPITVTLGNSLAAVDWVYQDAKDTPFNVDVYVPPVIPHAYNYLFLWRGTSKYHVLPKDNLISRLYTILEQDPPHPERLNTWLIRQKTYASINSSVTFGGVTAQRRIRYP